jgi:cullin-associated NEDD8-dissociated protein 1
LEVWATYVLLLNQTAVHAGVAKYSGEREAASPLKRKRDSEEPMDVDGSPIVALRSQVQACSKQLFSQLKGPKTPPTIMQQGFTLLSALLDVLPGSLASQTSHVMNITKSVLNQPFSTTTAPLNISALNLIALFFKTHSPGAYATALSSITPSLLASVRQKHPRVASESFRAFSALLRSLRPVKSADWADEIYVEAVGRLRTNDTDAAVRQCAEECLGELWVCAPEILKTKDGKEWEVILRSTDRTENPLKVITRVAEEADITDQWIDGCIHWILAVLKKSGRVGKADAFTCLEVLLRK